ncbi:MAG: IS66 family insertion sequence element accessory protein TnpB [Solobacterium sp.]|jgi:transposase|nr:IS66 family insertion sequence element accessory protein TnpB [Solobacterium sp.]MCH4013430.1 IS66 family insertion sequence element accessory protein TnpB [Solobacterium sp.]MCH4014251.1 IS66 family insertion sequence element accessory protein TnpB [Solobacterium sp.]MCH4048832.1 IS66 family insertion sequence element accessory protein TnpB [Solobacterium sp.]MCH4049451.1 IS66 family insertion sequence element accessory protein TnpB [Solobacterium sp.]
MIKDYHFKKVYLALGYTDLRYGIDGLAALVQEKFSLSPFDEGTLFIFCGRKSDRIKAICWEGDGFVLLYKRLSDGRFQWPRNSEELVNISQQQYEQLLNGFSVISSIRASSASSL